MGVHLPTRERISDIPYIAIGCRRFRADADRVITHAAIFYRDADEKMRALHLGGPEDLRHGDALRWEQHYVWSIPAFDPIEAESLADMCELIATRYRDKGDIPYGLEFSYNAKFRHGDGTLELGKLSGLTCATFVLAVFNSLDHRLLDIDTWQFRRSNCQ